MIRDLFLIHNKGIQGSRTGLVKRVDRTHLQEVSELLILPFNYIRWILGAGNSFNYVSSLNSELREPFSSISLVASRRSCKKLFSGYYLHLLRSVSEISGEHSTQDRVSISLSRSTSSVAAWIAKKASG